MLNSPSGASEYVQHQITYAHYVNLASVVILYYDFTLTFSAEVDRFWRSSLTWASGFFYVNRYLSLLGHVPVMMQYQWDVKRYGSKYCPALSMYHQYFAVVVQVVVGVLLTMRTYALYDRQRRILAGLGSLGLCLLVIGFWSVAAGSQTHDWDNMLSNYGCIPSINHKDSIRLSIAWGGMLLFDMVIFILTVYESRRRSRVGDRTLVKILLRDGAIYFGIMGALGLANILTFSLAPEYEKGFLTTFANTMSSTMISRLMLNLRHPKLLHGKRHKSEDGPVLSTVFEFNSVSDASRITICSEDEDECGQR